MSSNNMLLEDNNITKKIQFVFPTVNMINIAFIKVQQEDIFQNLITCDDYWVCLKKSYTLLMSLTQLGVGSFLLLPNYLCKYVVVILMLCLVCALFVTNTSVRPGMCFELPTPVAAQSTLRCVTLSGSFKGDTLVCMYACTHVGQLLQT